VFIPGAGRLLSDRVFCCEAHIYLIEVCLVVVERSLDLPWLEPVKCLPDADSITAFDPVNLDDLENLEPGAFDARHAALCAIDELDARHAPHLCGFVPPLLCIQRHLVSTQAQISSFRIHAWPGAYMRLKEERWARFVRQSGACTRPETPRPPGH